MSDMATVLSHKGYKVWVTCGETHARIYGPEYGDKTANCWIQSEAGKHFEVHVEAMDLRSAVSCYAYVDGVEVGGRVLEDGYRTTGTFRGQRVGRSASVKRMYFSNFAVSDVEDQVTATAIQDLGSIRVEVRRVRVYGNAKREPRSQKLPDGSIVVNEGAKKLGGHHALLGEEVSVAPTQTVGVEDLDKDPYVTFILQYRPYDILCARGVIEADERAEPPEPRSNKRPVSERDAAPASAKRLKAEHEESIESLKARIRELEARLPEEARSTVKTEEINAHLHFLPGQVVDLTLDDSE
ncbi:hypothetical protein AURDEDRAFT_115150 [Auricularia subglabra TFB-10046 SS5]|nr:hypothetical protein AURDEDRAFT_115150 [Auricularia subglabra TFB-10046 SS5]